MLLDYRGFADRIVTNSQVVGTGTPGTSVAEGTSPNYGSPVELISAAANDQESWGIWIFPNINQNPSAAQGQACLEIMHGASGSEQTLIPSLIVGGAYGTASRAFYFPLLIPPGTRISAKAATGVAHASDMSVVVQLLGGGAAPHPTGRKVTAYGTKINDSRGQAVVPSQSGAAASATQVTTGTSEDHFYWLPGFQEAVDTTIATQTFINAGIRVNSSAEDRIGTWWFGKDASERQSGPFPQMGVRRFVPAGTPVWLLTSNGGTNDTDYDGLVYAV